MPLIPWPEEIPCKPESHAYWLWDDTRAAFAKLLDVETKAYLEVGSWCGASARLAAELAPNAEIICIDAWDGRGGGQYESMSDRSLELFQANLWDFRDRVFMIQEPSMEGITQAGDLQFDVDIVYIDGDHATSITKIDIEMCQRRWPDARICGDDYNEGPGNAAREVFGDDLFVGNCNKFWCHSVGGF